MCSCVNYDIPFTKNPKLVNAVVNTLQHKSRMIYLFKGDVVKIYNREEEPIHGKDDEVDNDDDDDSDDDKEDVNNI